jgi:hypothetical protein
VQSIQLRHQLKILPQHLLLIIKQLIFHRIDEIFLLLRRSTCSCTDCQGVLAFMRQVMNFLT